MDRCASAASALLAHLNLIITLYGGAALATAARLKWDPSTYVVVRELFPFEYRLAAGGLTAGGFTLLLLPHVACIAQHSVAAGRRRALLYVYAALLAAVMLLQLSFGVWMVQHLTDILDTPQAQTLIDALKLRESLRSLLSFLGRWYSFPQHLNELIHEAEEDAPRNVYCAAGVGAVLALAQALALLAALLAARRPRHRTQSELSLQPRPPPYSAYGGRRALTFLLTILDGARARGDYRSVPSSPAPPRLRTKYKNGRIIILDP